MQFNKKYVAVLSIGALLGTAGVVALQAHAQQAPISNTTQNQVSTPSASTNSDVATQGDTDNIQDPGNVEKPDATETEAKDTDTETQDDVNGVNQ